MYHYDEKHPAAAIKYKKLRQPLYTSTLRRTASNVQTVPTHVVNEEVIKMNDNFIAQLAFLLSAYATHPKHTRTHFTH